MVSMISLLADLLYFLIQLILYQFIHKCLYFSDIHDAGDGAGRRFQHSGRIVIVLYTMWIIHKHQIKHCLHALYCEIILIRWTFNFMGRTIHKI